MSSEPRLQFKDGGTVVAEIYHDGSNMIIENNSQSESFTVTDIAQILAGGGLDIISLTTSSNQNINQTTDVSWDEEIVTKGSVITHSGTDVSVSENGVYRIYCNLYMNTTNYRTNPSFRFYINGSEVAGRSGSSYARDSNGHQSTSTALEIIQELSSGDTIKVRTFQEANGGTVRVQDRRSIFTVEKL
jgi:hypothetical protein